MCIFGDRSGLKRYVPGVDNDRTVVFLGLYHDQDYQIFLEHRGEKIVYWMGSDVSRLLKWPMFSHNGLNWFDVLGKFPKAIHHCDNVLLQAELAAINIHASIDLVLFADVENYPVSYKHSDRPACYSVAHPTREKEYGVPMILSVAMNMPEFQFHIYGITGHTTDNITYHGQISPEVMDAEIKEFQSCLRPNDHDGVSQTILKSALMAQFPLTYIEMEEIWNFSDQRMLEEQILRLKEMHEPNYALREKYLWLLK